VKEGIRGFTSVSAAFGRARRIQMGNPGSKKAAAQGGRLYPTGLQETTRSGEGNGDS
jgi:hypothetical protein